jgi:hypothetical protein
MRTNRTVGTVAVVALAALGGLTQAAPAAAQLANASARTLGLAQNSSAVIRGFGAVAVNPAGLAMPGSGFSLALLPMRIRSGLDPITLKDLADVQGTLVSDATKEAWLGRLENGGSESGSVGARLTALALSAGNFGFQMSTVGAVNIDLSPSIVEAILYGNAGRTGQPADLSLAGSAASGFAVTTAAFSAALPLATEAGAMAIGVTAKYSVGHGLLIAEDRGGKIGSDPIAIDVDFPIIMTGEDADIAGGGTGVGLDVGFMMQKERVSVSAAVLNVVNTFAWDESQLVYRPGTANVVQGSAESDFDERPLSGAPANLRAQIEEMTFDPIVQAGVAYDLDPDVTITGEVRNRFGDGLDISPKFHLGAGAEYRGLKVLHLRGGAAVISGGVQYAGGGSLVLGPVNLSAAMAARTGDTNQVLGQFTLSFGNR